MFKQEMKKALLNRRMLFVTVLSLVLLCLSAYNQLLSSYTFIDKKADDLTPVGLIQLLEIGENKYHIWVESFTYMQIIFVLAIVFPYTASYVSEKNNKYYYLSMIRTGINNYFRSKMLANCIAGGMALIIPEIIYYIILSIIARSEVLNPFTFYPVGLFSSLFSNFPDMYIGIQILLHFILGFCFSLFALGISSFFSNKIMAYIVPFLVYITCDIVVSSIDSIRRFAITNVYNFMSSTIYTWTDFLILNAMLFISGLLLFQFNKKMVIENG